MQNGTTTALAVTTVLATLTNATSSLAAIAALDTALNSVNTSRSSYGASQNRMTAALHNLESYTENLVASGVQDFLNQLRALDAVSTLKQFRQRAEVLRDVETEKALRALRNGSDPETVLRSMARGLTNKLLHEPSVQVRKATTEGRTEVTEWLRELHQLDALDADTTTSPEKL